MRWAVCASTIPDIQVMLAIVISSLVPQPSPPGRFPAPRQWPRRPLPRGSVLEFAFSSSPWFVSLRQIADGAAAKVAGPSGYATCLARTIELKRVGRHNGRASADPVSPPPATLGFARGNAPARRIPAGTSQPRTPQPAKDFRFVLCDSWPGVTSRRADWKVRRFKQFDIIDFKLKFSEAAIRKRPRAGPAPRLWSNFNRLEICAIFFKFSEIRSP